MLIVINHHYISNKKFEKGIYPITPKFFEDEIKKLSSRFKIISLAEIKEAIKNVEHEDYCLITFDDGLKEQYEIAFKIAKKHKVPIAFFVNSKQYEDNELLTVHKFQLIRTAKNSKEILDYLSQINGVNDKLKNINLKDIILQYRYDDLEMAKVKYLINFLLPKDMADYIINKMFKEIFGNTIKATDYYMSVDNIQELATLGYIGAHGHSHNPVSINDYMDIKKNIDFLNNLAKKRIEHFSYPYGSSSAISSEAIIYAKKMGIQYAYSMNRDINEKNINLMKINRFDVNDLSKNEKLKNIIERSE